MEPNYIGFRSPFAFIWYCFFLVAPLAYVYIVLMLLRDLCEYSPETIQQPLQQYLPILAKLITAMKSYNGYRLFDVWCVIEALFFIASKLKIRYLQSKDPLEASLSAAPMLDPDERRALWEHIVSAEPDPGWVSEWFLDHPSIDSISIYDILDFLCWAMFDGRNQEHLTTQELNDLEGFVEDLEYRISIHLYGNAVEEEKEETGSMVSDGGEKDNTTRDYDVTTNRNRTSSDDATAPAGTDSNNNYDSYSIDKMRYESPLRSKFRRSSNEGGRTPNSISTRRSESSFSILSIERPRPEKCQ
jgi:hypothetical protein